MRLKFFGFLIIFATLFFVLSKDAFAQVNGNNVGPELPDPPAGQSVVCGKGYTGTVAVINNLNDARPTNTAPCAHVVLRINVQAGDFGSSDIANFANQLNASNDFNNGGPTIVVLGIELNNLDQQGWNGSRSGDVGQDTVTAASQYAQIFNQFSAAISNHGKYLIAPAPPDLYNAVYDPAPWVSVFANRVQCNLVDVLVADVFDIAPAASVAGEGYTNLTSYQYLERHVCPGKHVVHFEGWGAWPGDTIQNQVNFLKTQALPAGVNTGTTLIVNNCGGFGGNTGGNSNSVKPWLYWIPTTPDKVYNADGSEFDYITCSGGGEAPKPFDISTETPCVDTTNPEFHSLRPYPASPCDKQLQDQTLLCSNDLVVIKSTSPNTCNSPGASGTIAGGGTCSCSTADSNGKFTCNYSNIPETSTVSIDLSGAELPIMGNTEDVPNGTWLSPNTSGNNLTDTQRVNNYVSWYLNGIVNRAEEDFSSYNEKNLVNFSGPLNKLLPFAGQELNRIATIDNAVATPGKPNSDQSARHDQIVGCPLSAQNAVLPCYMFNPQNLSALIPIFQSLIPGISLGDIQTAITALSLTNRLIPFASKEPPLEANYPDFPSFWRAYLGWLGNACTAQLLGTRFYFCANLNTNFWSHLFAYIPSSTTEDRVGTIGTNPSAAAPSCRTSGAPCSTTCANGRTFSDSCPGNGSFDSCSQWAIQACATVSSTPTGNPNGGQGQGGGVGISSSNDVTFTPSSTNNYEHNLYFAHMQEDAELASKLQSTFRSGQAGAESRSDTNTKPTIEPGCVIQDSRTNPGDNLYGNIDRPVNAKGVPDSKIDGTVKFKASYSCTFTPNASSSGTPVLDGTSGYGSNCGSAMASLTMFTQTPEAQNNWDILVGGSQSIFKRFYPQVGPNSLITEIKEIPAYTTATYQATDNNGVAAGSQSTAGAGDKTAQAKIYFPYIGGIQDYFLKGIQKALRPYGFDSEVLPGQNPSNNPDSPSAGMCQLAGSGFSSPALQTLVAKAAQWAHVPIQLLVTVVHGEACRGGGPLCTAPDSDILAWSAPGGQLPYNCNGTVSGGPLGFFDWTNWKDAVNMATGENRTPNVCNVKDAIYAAAYSLSSSYTSDPNSIACSHTSPSNPYSVNNTPAGASWTPAQTENILDTAWVCGCRSIDACGGRGQGIIQVYSDLLNQYEGSVSNSCNP